MRKPTTITLPPYHLAITAKNWRQVITDTAKESAFQALRELGPEATIELAYAFMEHYFTLTTGAAVPFLEAKNGSTAEKLAVLGSILQSANLKIEARTTVTAKP